MGKYTYITYTHIVILTADITFSSLLRVIANVFNEPCSKHNSFKMHFKQLLIVQLHLMPYKVTLLRPLLILIRNYAKNNYYNKTKGLGISSNDRLLS